MTTTDPFATAPDEAQAAPAENVAQVPWESHVAQAPAPVGDSEKIRITLKSGTGFEVPWITVDFPSIDVAHEKLSDLDRQKRLSEIFDIAARANTNFGSKVGGSAPASNGGGQRSNAPAAAQQPSAGSPPAPGPDWTFKSGAKKSGGTWKAWMPPRGSDAEPVWF